MPTLSVYRHGTLEWQGTVTDYTLRIGRSPDNDLVLEDPTKGVSRFHAELRWEHDGYVIADLGSQNGTWIAGQRIGTAPLVAGTEVALGPYRLVLGPEPAKEAEEVPTPPLPVGDLEPPPAAKPQPVDLADPNQAATMLPQEFATNEPTVLPPIAASTAAAPPPPPATPTAPPAAPSTDTRRAAAAALKSGVPAAATPVPPKKSGSATRLAAVAVGAIVLLLAVVGIRAVLLRRAATESADIEAAVAEAHAAQLRDASAGARQALAAGQPDRARQHVDAALALDPANGEAIALRQQVAAASAPAEPPAAAAETPVEVPEGSETPPATEQSRGAPSPPAPTSDQETGIVRQKGESPKGFARRVTDAKKLAAGLREAIDAGRVADARNLLSQLGSAAPNHTEIEPLTARVHALETHTRARAAQAAYDEGKRLQQSGTEPDLVGARAAYRKAGSLQAGLGDAELQQVDAHLKDLGRVALSNARNFQNFKRREQAIDQYKRALLLLGECADCEKALTDLQQP